ncbi:MAG: hypothetical protein IPM24_15250 [Bryobacterales bacterium]|nr:hypothetical protein [Bryobacterales bacterium]
MDWSRRGFLGGSAALLANWTGIPAFGNSGTNPYFGLHPFIEANPKAVFIRKTKVAGRLDGPGMKAEGLALGRQIFKPLNDAGIPVSHKVVLKPNVLTRREGGRQVNWGTDADFYEGLIIAMRDVGLRKFHYAEANYRTSRWSVQYDDIHDRYGVEVCEPHRRARHYRDSFEMNWGRPDDGVVYAQVPHYPPINEPDTWLLNIAKWRSHGMCLTQASKNLQGTTVWPFQRFCPGWDMVLGVPDCMKPFIGANVEKRVLKYFENHKRMGYSRYDSPHNLSPIRQEIWAHKTCDNLSVLKPGLSMIEAIYAKNEDPADPVKEFLPNMVMFAKDHFRLDIVGLWLGGHEPGNVNFYRTAKERGLSDTFNPWEVPVYEWTDEGPVRRNLTDFPRTLLKTYYLQKEGEPLYHMVDEPFDYDRYKL